jgi:NitT/TauT family transport system substrate-binding protein
MAERPLILAEKGFGAKNLVALENKNPLFLVLRKDHPATDVKGLKGTRLGMTRAGSGTDLSLRALLKDAGLEPDKDVSIIGVGGATSANAALKAGQVDGFMGGEPAGAIAVHQLKLARYFLDPRAGQGPKFLQYMTFSTLQASDRWIQANPQTAEKVVRAVVKTLKRMREDPEAAVQVAQKIFPSLDVSVIRSIINVEKATYFPSITEEAMRVLNQVQKQTGAVKIDVPYDKVVATQFKHLWDQ